MEFYDFPYIGNNHPNWLLYFSEGLKPPTSLCLMICFSVLLLGFVFMKHHPFSKTHFSHHRISWTPQQKIFGLVFTCQTKRMNIMTSPNTHRSGLWFPLQQLTTPILTIVTQQICGLTRVYPICSNNMIYIYNTCLLVNQVVRYVRTSTLIFCNKLQNSC